MVLNLLALLVFSALLCIVSLIVKNFVLVAVRLTSNFCVPVLVLGTENFVRRILQKVLFKLNRNFLNVLILALHPLINQIFTIHVQKIDFKLCIYLEQRRQR